MGTFLLWIGLYNALGSLVLMAMHSEKVANVVLSKGTEMISEPYTHGRFGRLWLWWAATANLFLGGVMALATRWPEQAQREVIVAALVVYVLMYVVVIVGGRKPPWGRRGVLSLHFLWPAQIAWGVWALWSD